MCGIIGIVVAPGGPPPDMAVGQAMNDVIRHRGPDDEGFFRDERALLGMRRLSVIDLAGGHQPMSAIEGRVQMVFNGEIYNYRELRAELEARGHKFETVSDSEVVVEAYAEWGEQCFSHLHGMFAIAIWDRRTQTLVLARDRFGEKPLFYSHDDSRILFASELKSLIQVPGFQRDIDANALRGYVRYGYVPTPESIFRSARKLPPGHYLKYVGGRIELKQYYALDFSRKNHLSDAESEERLIELLNDAVSSRMVADVPFGAFLSGGLDSSTVVALMCQHSSQRVRTYSIGFKEAEYNELSDARRVADHLGTDHHELVVEPDAVSLLEQLVWHLDEPFADSSAVPTFLVSQLARTQVTMVLTGDAGDEAFAGYTRYMRFLTLNRFGALASPAALAIRLGAGVVGGSLGYRLEGVASRMLRPFPDSYLDSVAQSRPETVRDLLGEAIRPYDDPLHRVAAKLTAGSSMLDRIVEIDFASYLPDDILVKIDRMAMANSLEGRVPFLDHRLVEFAIGLSDSQRVRGGRGKHLLRKVAQRWLPKEVLKKRKQGFSIPLGQWFHGPLRALAEDTIESREFRERGLIDVGAARACLQDHIAGRADRSETLWLILSLELWARRYAD